VESSQTKMGLAKRTSRGNVNADGVTTLHVKNKETLGYLARLGK